MKLTASCSTRISEMDSRRSSHGMKGRTRRAPRRVAPCSARSDPMQARRGAAATGGERGQAEARQVHQHRPLAHAADDACRADAVHQPPDKGPGPGRAHHGVLDDQNAALVDQAADALDIDGLLGG